MAGSIPESAFAERALAASAEVPVRDRRWDALRRAARARLAPFGAAVLIAAVIVAVGAPLLAPYDPLAQNLGNVLARPGRAHWLGTDNVGRDVLSRVIWGTRVSLVAGLVSVAIAAAAGSALGMLAGYAGGRADGVVMRLMDAVLSFPPLVLALALGAVLGSALALLALGLLLIVLAVRGPAPARRRRR
jgi:ABC-type dipeptide/oligopeptide/nickel transport system permease subunit